MLLSTLTVTEASAGGMFASASRHAGVQGGDGARTLVTNDGAKEDERTKATTNTASFGFKEGPTSAIGRL